LNLLRTSLILCCLTALGCGPFLDWKDSVTGVIGPNTPHGIWKRDFYGNTYFEPYYPSQMKTDEHPSNP
jgi:hypothetical protein